MPAPPPAPHVPPDFPPLDAIGGQTACLGGQTAPRTETGGQTVSSGGQTTRETEAGSQTVSPGGQTAHRTGVGNPITRPCTATLSPASPTSVAPRVGPTSLNVPHAVPSTPPVPRVAPASQLYLQNYSCHPWAAWKPPTPPLHQQLPPAKGVPVAPPINPHPMTMRVKRDFRLPADRLTLSATTTSTLSPLPSSVRVALIDPNWCRVMKEEFVALIANNT
jgi:hypothetical protein